MNALSDNEFFRIVVIPSFSCFFASLGINIPFDCAVIVSTIGIVEIVYLGILLMLQIVLQTRRATVTVLIL